MSAIVFTPDRNTPGRKDYTGAFQPEARAFARQHGLECTRIVPIDVSKPGYDRRRHVLAQLGERAGDEIDVVAFFCHGLRSGLHQLGFGLQQVTELAHAIARAAPMPRATVALYACSTGGGPGPGGDGGFADKLRDALCVAGCVQCEVTAHDRAGHTTRLPYVRRFSGLGSPVGGTGGTWVVAPGSPLWRAWRRALAGKGDLRLRFPMMSIGDIHRELLGAEELVA